VHTRFILGPAGTGKTFRCLAEIRAVLADEPDGPPLVLLAPKQTTYQLERQLLSDPATRGYTRLHILSFERLAFLVFDLLQEPPPRLLDEEGRLMVLRALLAKKRDDLKLFRASARLTGFAQQLSLVLRELQRQQMTPESLAKLAEEVQGVPGLSAKLQDLATLLQEYLAWLRDRGLRDADYLLDYATQLLREPHAPLGLAQLWVDGFAELSPQELDLLAEVAAQTENVTVTFCLDRVPAEKVSWLSNWSVMRRAFQQCRARLAALPHNQLVTELLPRRMEQGRFAGNQALQHLEFHWAAPQPFDKNISITDAVRVAACADAEAEVVLAAREILRFVRAGGRFREVNVLARDLKTYHDALVNTFQRYEIPFFLDRRESVSHHPLAELSRNALRTVAFSWARDDWFAALKTGLAPVSETEIDRLENEALERGWKGAAWHQPLSIPDQTELAEELERVRRKIIPPFARFAANLGHKPTGAELASAMRAFWQTLDVAGTLETWSAQPGGPRPIHLTVWEQMNAWLENVVLAFGEEPLPLREWLPILEAGLAGLTVGVIPPALDQVTIGAIDRSRNPEIRLAILLGMNESVFPAQPQPSVLLTETDRAALEAQGIPLSTARQQLGQERYYGYVACTRARQRLVLTCAAADSDGKPLNPSPFITQLQQLFPALEIETVPREIDWRQSEHASEFILPLLRGSVASVGNQLAELDDLPAIIRLRGQLRHLIATPGAESLAPHLARSLYGPGLRTSVSRMEQFAACPFKFFVHSGLRAGERKLFEIDIRDQGNFQHEVLAEYHEELRAEGKRWRDLAPEEARERVKTVAAARMVGFRDGLFQASEEGRFTARVLAESLQDFVETLVGWMRRQYPFDPMRVELPFGDENFPPWDLDLGGGHRLLLHGRIDRIDILPDAGGEQARCVVVDYKSSQKQLDSLLMEHGLQLQLPAYLNVLRHWPNPKLLFGVAKLIPAGVFYVNLRGKYERGENRDEALANVDAARKLAYRHSGRFDAEMLGHLDQRPGVKEGDQFNYRRNKDGGISGNSKEAMRPGEFLAMLDGVETALKQMGQSIYAGVARVDPFRKGLVTACEQCDYRSICRIDPWTHGYRVLRKAEKQNEK
jgi:ATP-dependent helicase/nuclease subunit B